MVLPFGFLVGEHIGILQLPGDIVDCFHSFGMFAGKVEDFGSISLVSHIVGLVIGDGFCKFACIFCKLCESVGTCFRGIAVLCRVKQCGGAFEGLHRSFKRLGVDAELCQSGVVAESKVAFCNVFKRCRDFAYKFVEFGDTVVKAFDSGFVGNLYVVSLVFRGYFFVKCLYLFGICGYFFGNLVAGVSVVVGIETVFLIYFYRPLTYCLDGCGDIGSLL